MHSFFSHKVPHLILKAGVWLGLQFWSHEVLAGVENILQEFDNKLHKQTATHTEMRTCCANLCSAALKKLLRKNAATNYATNMQVDK